MRKYSARRPAGLIAVLLALACSPKLEASENRNIQKPSIDGTVISQLFEASASGNVGVVRRIVESNGPAIANYQAQPTRATPLLRAVEFRHIEVAGYLLAHGAKVDPEDVQKGTPLMHACYVGDAAMVRLLLEAGANPDAQETRFGDTPLTFAAWKGHEEIVKLLLAAGANQTIKTNDGDTAMMLAVRKKYSRIVAALNAASGAERPSRNIEGK